MKVRPGSVTVMVLATVVVAASLLSRVLLGSLREPEVYDPSGGPLAVDGVWIGMTYGEVVRCTGQRPDKIVSIIHVDHVVPGCGLDPRVGFNRPPGGTLEDATVGFVEGMVLTQDGRVLLDFHSVSRRNPARLKDVVDALGRPGNYENCNIYYYMGDLDLTIIHTEEKPTLAEMDLKLISLGLSDRPAPNSPRPSQPDPEGSTKPRE